MRSRPFLGRQSSVLAVVTHYRCEAWLAQCIDSLLKQTRPLEGIVVVDDASPTPPIEIVGRYPHVTLLATAENVGPYRLMQEVFNRTDYDAYLIQDADDWSSPDRLEVLLAEAERTVAELVGSQAVHILYEENRQEPFAQRPLDANAAYALNPTGHFLMFGSALVGRNLLLRLGGLATGLRFGADGEFLRRATYAARIVNTPQFCYFRRKRRNSLTSHPETGMQSPARRDLLAQLHERAKENATAVARGESPNLSPYATAGPIKQHHMLGPQLRCSALPQQS